MQIALEENAPLAWPLHISGSQPALWHPHVSPLFLSFPGCWFLFLYVTVAMTRMGSTNHQHSSAAIWFLLWVTPEEIDQLYKLNPEHSSSHLEFTVPYAEDIFKGREMSDLLMSDVPASSLCLPFVVHILTIQSGLSCSNPVFECNWKRLLGFFSFLF